MSDTYPRPITVTVSESGRTRIYALSPDTVPPELNAIREAAKERVRADVIAIVKRRLQGRLYGR